MKGFLIQRYESSELRDVGRSKNLVCVCFVFAFVLVWVRVWGLGLGSGSGVGGIGRRPLNPPQHPTARGAARRVKPLQDYNFEKIE